MDYDPDDPAKAKVLYPFVTTKNNVTGERVKIKVLEGEGAATQKPFQEFLKLARADDPKFQVLIHADEKLQYKYIEPVLESALRAKVTVVNFAAQKPQQQTVVGPQS